MHLICAQPAPKTRPPLRRGGLGWQTGEPRPVMALATAPASAARSSSSRRWTRWLRLSAPCAALVVASCAGLIDPHPSDVSPKRLFSVGYKNMSERYIHPVDLRAVSVAGLGNLSGIDPEIGFAEQGGAIVLIANSFPSGEWKSPAATDVSGWARVTAAALRTARIASPALRARSPAELSDTVFQGMMTRFDRYSRYADPAKARRNRAARDGFGGIGITIRYRNGITHILKVHAGMPADRAGIRPDDRITHVDGVAIAGSDQSRVVGLLRGRIDSEVRLRLSRPGQEAAIELSLTRRLIVLPTVKARRADGIAILKINQFNQGTAKEVKQALNRAESEMGSALKGVVLDLRGNPGGLLDQAVAVADLLLADGLIVATEGRHPRSRQSFNAGWAEIATNVPVAVLVNGRSASASEILAIALRDKGRAVVIGSSSYGKGTVQTIIRLPNGGELTLTWARMQAPSGFPIQDHGIIPAICTSAQDGRVQGLLKALRQRSEAGIGALSGILEARLSHRHDPREARAACPPSRLEPSADMELAQRLLHDRSLYARTLSDGRPAVAAGGNETE